jgi:choice-of-anchor B domain-containing protein
LFLLLFGFLSASAQVNISYRDHLPYQKILSDVWGYHHPSGKEYALVGVFDGVSIVDVSDPDNLQELFFLDGPESFWRDLKTYRNFAYVVNEDSLGLRIIDLSQLPAAISDKRWIGDSLDIQTCHNIYIDTSGIAALFGCDVGSGGAVILDLKPDPRNPEFLGIYDQAYCHDGFIRGDTLWTAELYLGEFGIVDISAPSNPIRIASNSTPRNFTHNVWLSDDSKVLYTTDERAGAPIAAYSVDDLFDISRLDIYKSPRGDSVIPHNVHVLGDYLVNSYYHEGITIVDVSRPDNMVEVGRYDTSPIGSIKGFGGCWGAYPYLPSRLILASDRQEGLFVLDPTYTRAAYLEGNIRKQADNFPVANAKIEIVGTGISDRSNIIGDFKTGIGQAGSYDLRLSASGCQTKIISGIRLSSDSTTVLDLKMDCYLTGIDQALESDYFEAVYRDGLSLLNYDVSHPGAMSLSLEIYDLSGRMWLHQALSRQSGSLAIPAELPSGWYLARLKSEASQSHLRFYHIAY